jgi:AraC-like DNA-binding protein
MINYYKYLPVSKEDERWGLTVLNAGCTHIEASHTYPMRNHPAHHYFNWNSWRILQEFQIIYITKGKGIFESDSCKQSSVNAGTIIVLFPGEKHRYKPDSDTGWDEYWVGIKGEIIDNLLVNNFIKPEQPCIFIGFNEAVFNLFDGIIQKTRQETPGYQPMISGAVLHLIGTFNAISRQNLVENKEEEIIINKARLLFRENINNDYSPESAALELNVGYSRFRKLFKNYTGLSPGQYYIQLKIEKAKELLSSPEYSVKQIAVDLSFESNFYFSKVFREKTGLTPTEYRKKCLAQWS